MRSLFGFQFPVFVEIIPFPLIFIILLAEHRVDALDFLGLFLLTPDEDLPFQFVPRFYYSFNDVFNLI